VSSTPHRIQEPEPQNGRKIGKTVRVVGQIFTKEDLEIDGEVEGTIESPDNKITIGPSGRVQADIHACNVVVLGQLQGNVAAREKVDIRKDAAVVAEITASRISIEDGAVFNGRINNEKPEPRPLAVPGLKYSIAESVDQEVDSPAV
jgi:cytoskeletal protein CcmA (bactofilin family)